MLLRCGKFQCGIEHRRVLPEIVILTCRIHVACPREEALDVKSNARRKRESDLGKNRKASAHTVRHGELLPAHIHRELFEQSRLLLVRIGDRNYLDFNVVCLFERVIHHHEVGHRVKRAARLRDHEEHDAQRLSAVGFLDLCDVL